jgi:hypothetical protein
LEVRSTVPDVLATLPFDFEAVPEDTEANTMSGYLSFVGGSDERRGVRRLPSVYLLAGQLFADRDVQLVKARLILQVEIARTARRRSLYLAHACEFHGLKGLYIRDQFNRSAYRNRLRRRGVVFADDPIAEFRDGEFSVQDWGSFRPSFVIGGGETDDDGAVQRYEGLRAAFAMTAVRLGMPSTREVIEIQAALASAPMLATSDPRQLGPELENLVDD